MKVERIAPIPLDKKQALTYAAVVASEYGHGRAASAKYLGGGSFGRAVGVTMNDGSRLVVKLLRGSGMMDKEVHDLRLLAKHCPIPFPEVYFSRAADEAVPVDCYGMEWLDGKSGLFALGMLLQSKRKRLAFADKVTGALHSIHECTNDRFGDTMRPEFGSWQEYYKPFADEVFAVAERMNAEGNLPDKVMGAMRAAYKEYDVIFSEAPTRACLIHGDLNIANIMIGKGYKITGFIDPLNSAYADREYDLFQFDNLTGKRFMLREVYLEKYGASRYCMQKLAFYGLWNEVYCYIKSGVLVGLIMDPLVKNMYRRLSGS